MEFYFKQTGEKTNVVALSKFIVGNGMTPQLIDWFLEAPYIQTLTDVIKKIRSNDALQSTKIMVGGYPFKLAPKLWQKVGADGFAESASQALEIAEKFITKLNI